MGKRELIIIGAGAAGMFAAVSAAQNGVSVLLLEKMEKAGRKIRITGKGRCNITNMKDWNEFSSHIHPKSLFFKPAFYNFSSSETVRFFESIGLSTVIERGDRVYPRSGQSKDVVEYLVKHLLSLGVEILYNSKVIDIQCNNNKVERVVWSKNGTKHAEETKAVIVATGGLSYPSTGSDGDGYLFAKRLGHNVTECWPSLTALMPGNYNTELEGLKLKNVEIELYIGGNPAQSERGDLEFTNNGIEGPIGFKISRKAVKAMKNGEKIYTVIDLKPALTEEQVTNRIKRELKENGVLRTWNLLNLLLPKQLVSPFLISNKIKVEKYVSVNDDKMVNLLAKTLKYWKLDIDKYTSYERAVVTAGGVSLDEIVSKNMSSKLCSNLFFAGEVIDLDADTGGYNLQIAFSTGYMAGKEAAHLIQKSR
ncbi:MAG: aminoacetone oxidase family FAD-binding enzyme [Rikenellaceae bacterium]